jgi:geranylgeranyl diphosphate synthase type II
MQGEGQALNLDQLQALHAAKTGALITASCRMGAIAAGARADVLGRVTEYGRALGLAFQIVDDVLDRTSTPEQLGKGTAKDAGRGKNTFPGLLGLEESRAEARRQVGRAAASIAPLGAASEGLRAIAQFVVDRQV